MGNGNIENHIQDYFKSGNIKTNYLKKTHDMNINHFHNYNKCKDNWKTNIQTIFIPSIIDVYNVNIEKNVLLQVYYYFFFICI
jgi:hypothetical protein